MSMRIQDALSNCCEGVKNFGSAAVSWIGKSVTAIGSFISGIAKKIAEFVKPYFERLKTFAQENQQPLIIAAVAFTLGAILTAIFCRGTGTTPVSTSAGTPAPTSSAGTPAPVSS